MCNTKLSSPSSSGAVGFKSKLEKVEQKVQE